MGNNGTAAGLVSSCLPEAVPSHDCRQPSCRAKSSNFLRCSTFSARMTRFDLVYLATPHLALDVPLSTSRPFLPSARPSSIYRKKSVTQRALAVRNAAPRPLSTTHAIDPYTRSTASSNINVVAMCAGGSRGRNYLETHMLDREYFRIQFRWRNRRLNIYRFYNCRTEKRVLRNENVARFLDRDPMPFLSNVGANFIYNEQPGDSKWNWGMGMLCFPIRRQVVRLTDVYARSKMCNTSE